MRHQPPASPRDESSTLVSGVLPVLETSMTEVAASPWPMVSCSCSGVTWRGGVGVADDHGHLVPLRPAAQRADDDARRRLFVPGPQGEVADQQGQSPDLPVDPGDVEQSPQEAHGDEKEDHRRETHGPGLDRPQATLRAS